jgi:hypothetical protein
MMSEKEEKQICARKKTGKSFSKKTHIQLIRLGARAINFQEHFAADFLHRKQH